jgi:hypothetical protein
MNRSLSSIILSFTVCLVGFVGNVSADFTATGQFNYTDRTYGDVGSGTIAFTGSQVLPVRFAIVEIFDANDDTQLAMGLTDNNGNYSINVPFDVNRTVQARVCASSDQSGDSPFSVVDDANDNAIYQFTNTSTFPVTSGTTNVDFGISTMPLATGTPGVVNPSSQVFNVLDLCQRTADYLILQGVATPLPNFTVGFNPLNGRGGSFYNGGSNRFSLSDDDGYDDPNIIHELGHYMEDEFGASANTGGAHFIGDDDQDIRLAWSEGLATYFSNAVLMQAGLPLPEVYMDRDSFSTGNSANSGFDYSVEPQVQGGATNELAVNAALYDMIDEGTNESATDTLSGQDNNIFTIMEEFRIRDTQATSMEDFWDIWFDLGLGSDAQLISIFQSHFIDFTPDANEPNDTLETATTLIPSTSPAYIPNTFYRMGDNPGGDEDWFKFDAVEDTIYCVEVEDLPNTLFGRPDPEIFLFDSDGNLLAYHDDPRDTIPNNQSSSTAQDMRESAPSILWKAPASGTYYVLARHASYRKDGEGRYGYYEIRSREIVNLPAINVDEHSIPRMLAGETYQFIVQTDASVLTIDDTSVSTSLPTDSLDYTWLGPRTLGITVAVSGTAASGLYDLTLGNIAGEVTLTDAIEVDAANASPPVVISEIELGFDRVEIINIGTVPANLSNWSLIGRVAQDTPQTFTFPVGFTLPAGGIVVVSEGTGTDTATELFDNAQLFNWPWFNGFQGSCDLIDDDGFAIDNVRFITRIVDTYMLPTGTGALWAQPEFRSTPDGNTVSRHLPSAFYRTKQGLAQAANSMDTANRVNFNDSAEENDQVRMSRIIGRTTTINDLNLNPLSASGDEDWFGIYVPAGGVANVRLTFAHSDGDVNANIYAPGTESSPILTADSTTDNEQLVITSGISSANGGGIYRLQVLNASLLDANTYDLNVSLPLTDVSPGIFLR